MVDIGPAVDLAPQVAAWRFGGERIDLTVQGWRGFVILPQHTRQRHLPWVWYQPTFLGPHPSNPLANPGALIYPSEDHVWLCSQLLAAGVAVAGIEIGETYGNPAGRAAQTVFYQAVVPRFGLARRARLLAQSRGGLMHYNWAVEHPDLVERIAGIYPVTDIRSWIGVAEIARRGYGWSETEMLARLAEHNPIERLAPLAAHGVRILHVHGDADLPVPAQANTLAFAERYRALGGSIEVIIVEGEGHNHSPRMFQEPRLLAFLA